MKLKLVLAAMACLMGTPAAAKTCQFTLAGSVTEPGTYNGRPLSASFTLDCSQQADFTDTANNYFLYKAVPGTYDGPGIGGNNGQGTGPLFTADVGFYPSDNGGGLSANYPDDGSENGGFGLYSPLGAQLYTGTLGNPTFTPGRYALTRDFYYGAIDATLSIAAVPEPATWAMMMMGLGAVGFAIRRRRSAVRARVRFA